MKKSVSVVIAARNEKYLVQTVENLRQHAGQEAEVIVALDGPTEFAVPQNNCIVMERDAEGIRPTLNAAVAKARGAIILKVDAHCIFGHGFISTLADDYEDGVVVAGRYTLDLETMSARPRRVDYYYLSCPWTHPKAFMMQSCPWISKTEARADVAIDDLMCFQGSMWMMSRQHWDWLGGLGTDLTYAEHHEISMKTWLGGSRVQINKNAWYAHPAKEVRGYHMSRQQVYKDHDASARYWTERHNFEWFIDKCWPLPTEHTRHRVEKYYWPDDWKKYYAH